LRSETRSRFAAVTVDIINDARNLNPVTIHVSKTVQWVCLAANHSTTSVTGSLEFGRPDRRAEHSKESDRRYYDHGEVWVGSTIISPDMPS
jgi:hypothetical protein